MSLVSLTRGLTIALLFLAPGLPAAAQSAPPPANLRPLPVGELDLRTMMGVGDRGESAAPSEGVSVALDLADRRSIAREGDMVRIWRLMIFNSGHRDQIGGRDIAARWAETLVDCRLRTTRRLGAVDVAENGDLLRTRGGDSYTTDTRPIVYRLGRRPDNPETNVAMLACDGRETYPAAEKLTSFAQALARAKTGPAPAPVRTRSNSRPPPVFTRPAGCEPANMSPLTCPDVDFDKPVLLRATVSSLDRASPSVWLRLWIDPSTGGDVQPSQWSVRGGSYSDMLRAGFDETTFRTGATIVVRAYRLKNQTCETVCAAAAQAIIFTSGGR